MTAFVVLLILAVVMIVADALARTADERRRLEEDREREQRIAAGRARAEREYQRRVEALRKAGDQ